MATTLQPFVNGRFQALDSNGNPLSGGLLYTYLAGTSTPQGTYTDSAGGVANANPVVLDASGEADVWLTTTANYKFVLKDSGGVIQWTVDNFPPGGSGSSSSSNPQTLDPGGRLTLTAGTPVTIGDVTAATTLYYVPYEHDQVPLYDGTAWALYSIGTGISQTLADNTKSPAAAVASSGYDLFIWNDNGTVRLSRGPAWTSTTTRGTGIGTTELTQQNGRYVNKNAITNGPAASRGLYVGSAYTNGSVTLNDAMLLRTVWNNNNRVIRPLRLIPSSTWTYTTAAWRQTNGAGSSEWLSMFIGLSEDGVTAEAAHHASTVGGSGLAYTGIGLDSTSSPAAGCIVVPGWIQNGSTEGSPVALWRGQPGLGLHSFVWLEYSGSTAGTTTWVGSSSPTLTGIQAECRA